MQASLPVIVFCLRQLSFFSERMSYLGLSSWVMDYGGFAPYAPSNFLPTAGESYQREPPPDFVPSYLRRLSAKSPQLALRFATGFKHTDFLYAAFAVNLGHIRNGGKKKAVGTLSMPLRRYATPPPRGRRIEKRR